MQKKSKVLWKYSFWGLAVLNISIVILVFFLFTSPIEKKSLEMDPNTENTNNVAIDIHTNREQFGKLIENRISNGGQEKKGDIQVHVSDVIELNYRINALGREIDLDMKFLPEVQENGDLILKQQAVAINNIEMTGGRPLQMMDRFIAPHDGITIMPDEEQIYLSLSEMNNGKNFRFKAVKMDLGNDDITMQLVIPSDKEAKS